ncbi:MAG: hypothetical protein WCO65_01305 [bacterium]
MSEKNKKIIIAICLSVTTVFMGVSFFAWTLVPHLQMSEYLKNIQNASKEHRASVLLSTFNTNAFMFEPETYVQGYVREVFLNEMFIQYRSGAFANSALLPLLDIALQKNIEYAIHHPDFYEYDFNIAKAYDAKYSLNPNKEYLSESEKYYKHALEIIPNRQEVIYGYSTSLLNQGRNQEAIDLLNKAIVTNPYIPQNHYQLGQALYFTGYEKYNDSLDQFEFSLNSEVDMVSELTKQAYLKFFVYFYKQNDIKRFTETVQRLISIDPEQKASYQTIVDYIQKNHTMPLVNIEN